MKPGEYALNPEKYCRQRREWNRRNPKKRRAQYERKYAKHRAAIIRKNVENREKKIYGVSPEQRKLALEKQDGHCFFCETPDFPRRLHIDHCHKTGKFRGLLCYKHNHQIGWFESFTPELVEKFKAYLAAPGFFADVCSQG